MLLLVCFLFLSLHNCLGYSTEEKPQCTEPSWKCVVSTKVFTMKVEPQLFRWNTSGICLTTILKFYIIFSILLRHYMKFSFPFLFTEENPDRYTYRPSLQGSPDLPSWMQYVYSKTHHSGFIYGTPPAHQSDFTVGQ